MKFKPTPIYKTRRRIPLWAWSIVAVGGLLVVGLLVYRTLRSPSSQRWLRYRAYLQNRSDFQDVLLHPGMHCDGSPFAFPTTGVIFGLWGESYRPGHIHAGVDIFAGTEPGVTPIYAAYPGYLTRKSDWLSTVIIRHPSDPLEPGRQIWTYYTHMASEDGKQSFVSEAFPPGTEEVFVEAGTFLGYQGNYSGTPDNPTGLHLHFSVVKDDGNGNFLNELEIANTYDPSPYLNLAVNDRENPEGFPVCRGSVTYEDWHLVAGDE
jgi:hypothetical protein